MGIPKFYRWLSERYPLINQKIDTQVAPAFDALYLDMNAIFHRCSHGEEVDKYTITKHKMFTDIFKYISYLVRLAKPTKLLFLAVDGVAPRAKQNQQRQRRFVGAAEMKADEHSDDKPRAYKFDSNIITPGTRWMEELTRQLELYIRKQMSEDNLWKQLTVIYSDHLVPGEGEHKIMEHIRAQKMQPDYNPNTKHCIYGLDADLVILSLVVHEMHFALLREEVIFALHEQESINKRTRRRLTKTGQFQLLHISVLRHYLFIEFVNIHKTLPFAFDFERVVDDFVFISMFVGNDFIPHLPTVNIGTGGMEHLFTIYKQVLPTMDGYVLEKGTINLRRFKILCSRLAEGEIECFVQHFQFLKIYHEKASRRKHSYFPMLTIEKTQNFRQLNAEQLGQLIVSLRDSTNPETCKNFREKYYSSRWKKRLNVEDRRRICLDYVRALQWVVNYYYQGVCSWGFYFPHHYAPLVSDMQYIDETNQGDVDHITKFDLGAPFKPFEQLLAVLPRHSNWMLPEAYRNLMENPESPIFKYYPEKFEVDMNLSVSPWEGIALLPFIDEADLKAAVTSIDESALNQNHQFVNCAKEAVQFNYDYKKSLIKNRIKGPIGFGPVGDDVVCVKYVPPSMEHCGGKFKATLPPGANPVLPGLPHISAIPFNYVIKKVPVKTFGMSSKYQTMVLQVMDPDATPSDGNTTQNQHSYENLALSYLKKFLSHPLYCGWPYFREAQITEISTLNFTHSIVHLLDNKTHTMTNQLTPQQRTKFKKQCHVVSQRYLSIYGVDVGDIHILIKCRMLWGMVKRGDEIVQKWCNEEEIFPIQICICGTTKSGYDDIGHISTAGGAMNQSSTVTSSVSLIGTDDDCKTQHSDLQRNMLTMMGFDTVSQLGSLVLDERYFSKKLSLDGGQEVGQPVMYIGSQQKYHGLCGRITSPPKNGFVDIRVLARFAPTDFPQRVLEKMRPTKYFTLEEAAHILQLDYKVLSRICAQVIVVHKPMDFDIGLNLKLYKKRLLIPGFCWVQFLKPKAHNRRNNGRNKRRSDNNQKERLLVKISQEAIDLIKRYKEKFPEVFSVLRCKHYSKQFYPDEFSRDTLKRLLPSEEFTKHTQNHQIPRAPMGPFGPNVDDVSTSVITTTSISATTGSNTDSRDSLSMNDGFGNRRVPKTSEDDEKSSLDLANANGSRNEEDGKEDLTSSNVEALGVEMEEEEEIVIGMEVQEEEEEEIVMSGPTQTTQEMTTSNVAELSAEDYKMLMRTKKCAEGKNFLMKIMEWLQEQQVSKLPLIDFKSKFLPMEVMQEIEREATKFSNQQIRNTPKAYHLKRVPVSQVYFANPKIPWSPTAKETFHLGNRVAVLRSDGGIPFGTLGTVVGLHDTYLEVITDCNVMKGGTLHNRCSDHRGCIVSYTSVINLTPNKPAPAVTNPGGCEANIPHGQRPNNARPNMPMHTNGQQHQGPNRKQRGQQNRMNRNQGQRGQKGIQNMHHHNGHNQQRNPRGGRGNPNMAQQGLHGHNGMRPQQTPQQRHQNNLMMNQRMLNSNNREMQFNQQMLGGAPSMPMSSVSSITTNGAPMLNGMANQMTPSMTPNLMPNMLNMKGPQGQQQPQQMMNLPMMSIPNLQSAGNSSMGVPMAMPMGMPMGMNNMAMPMLNTPSMPNSNMSTPMVATPGGNLMGQFNNLNIINHQQNHLTMQMMQQHQHQQQQQHRVKHRQQHHQHPQFNRQQPQNFMSPKFQQNQRY